MTSKKIEWDWDKIEESQGKSILKMRKLEYKEVN